LAPGLAEGKKKGYYFKFNKGGNGGLDAYNQPVNQEGANCSHKKDNCSSLEGVSSEKGGMYSSLHLNSQETKLRPAESSSGEADKRFRSNHLYSGNGT
jgi:hypothetical protein